jgi:parallel beta-helix repeat protein
MNCNLTTTKLCFSIGEDNIVIDGAGYSIDYDSFYGINNSQGYDNITIRNLAINQTDTSAQGFHIFMNNSDNSTVEYCNLSNGKAGILALNSFNTTVRHNQGSKFSHGEATSWATCDPFNSTDPYMYFETGIWFVESNNGTIYNNTIYGNETENGAGNHLGTEAGITLCRSNHTNVSTNTIRYTDTFGIYLTNSHYIDVFYNFINGSDYSGNQNTNDGIIVGGASADVDSGSCSEINISFSEFHSCAEWGIFLTTSNNNTIYNNTANRADVGIRIGGSSGYNKIYDNIAKNNGLSGIRVEGSYNLIRGNQFLLNDKGVEFEDTSAGGCDGNILWDSYIDSNNYGIQFYGQETDVLNNTVRDTNMTNSTSYDIRLISGTTTEPLNNTLLNVSFNKSSVSVQSHSVVHRVYVKWYMDVYVNYSNSSNATGATVNIHNVSETLAFIDTVDVNGLTTRQNITEYFENETGDRILQNTLKMKLENSF